MATANTIRLDASQHPLYYVPGIENEATKVTSDLLNKNHQQHHIFFNNAGFHNHIVHHLLTVWALKAESSEITGHYNNNQGYQRQLPPVKRENVLEMADPEKFAGFLGNKRHYEDFLEFFKQEISESSWQEVLLKYVFARDARADDMLVRLFAGFLHPIIHLGFGIEFEQPAIIAEALAQAAVHDNWMRLLLLPAEQEAAKRDQTDSIASLIGRMQADPVIKSAARYSDGNKLRDGVIARASSRMVDYAAQVSTEVDNLERATAEMINAAAWYTGGAQRVDKQVKFDFYYIHCVNSSIFFSSFLKADWLSSEDKTRILDWKIRTDMAMYVSRGTPPIRMDIVREYKPKRPSGWEGIIERVCQFEDDGHTCKLVRALAHGQNVCKPYQTREEFKVKQDDWLQLGHMAIDSVEASGPNWVRDVGFDEAWEQIGTRL
ncbi:hypothetical protein K431DRAFT_215297 [Polychaeton citri CBS 116435]|uniref:HypA-like protein n=1 Tax=Polychaeton citri CBS 116435 TaxID=1314669 RepID=A0A9P4QIM6_9PEZI|nr:hypothetical protein K431DRAFT_215297 [Polychaeton citri CBS 116435]